MSWDAEDLQRLTAALAGHIGPLAKVLVKNASAKARSCEQLVTELATHIKSDADRDAFRKKCGRFQHGEQTTQTSSPSLLDPGATLAMGSDHGQAFQLDEPTRIQLEQALTVHVGPVARMLIKRMMKQARSLADLIKVLVAQVPDAEGRAVFQKVTRPLL